MTILTADILDRDPSGAAGLRACLASDARYGRLRSLAAVAGSANRPFPLAAPRGVTLHGLAAMGAFIAASAVAAGAAARFGGF